MESPIYNEWVEEERREAMEEGRELAKIEIAKKMLENRLDLKKIMEFTELSKEQIEKLREP